jgi:hypothetical protein
VRLRDSDDSGRVAPRRGDEEETSIEAQMSDDEDRRRNRLDQRRSEGYPCSEPWRKNHRFWL